MMDAQSLQMQDEAAEWVALIDADNWDSELEASLQNWLSGDPRRQGALLRAQAAWMTLDKPEQASIRDASGMLENQMPRRALLAASAIGLIALFAGGLSRLSSEKGYATEVGEIRRVPLADGSVAAINTQSKLSIKLEEKRREVRIERGEAWFQVAKDPKRPFIVEAGPIRVQAVGTAFSVRRREDGADILVTEGVVEVWSAEAQKRKISLSAGQRAFMANDAAIARARAEPSSVDRALAWRWGKIDLEGDTLSTAVNEFNRYNNRQIIISDSKISYERFDGVFRIDDPEGFAVAIKRSLDVPIDLSNPGQILIGTSSG